VRGGMHYGLTESKLSRQHVVFFESISRVPWAVDGKALQAQRLQILLRPALFVMCVCVYVCAWGCYKVVNRIVGHGSCRRTHTMGM
jgi:hypothetical protein